MISYLKKSRNEDMYVIVLHQLGAFSVKGHKPSDFWNILKYLPKVDSVVWIPEPPAPKLTAPGQMKI